MEIYRDFYGSQACIRKMKSGSVRLTVHVGTKLVFAKNYKTYRGAKIAMGMLTDGGWRRV